MKEKKKNGQNFYVRAEGDVSWESKEVVVKKLSATMVENMSNNRLVYYKFDI